MMPIQHNNKQLVRRFRGTQEIVASYRGTQRIYSSMSAHIIETIPGITHWLPMKGGYDDVRFPAGNLSSTISSFNRDTAVSLNSDSNGNNTLNTWGNGQTALVNLASAWPTGGSIGAWFKMSSNQPSGAGMILHKFSGAANPPYELYLNTDAAIGYLYAGAKVGGTWWDVRVTTPLISNGNWYFVYAEVIRDPFQSSTWTLRVRVVGPGVSTANSATRTGLSSAGFPSNDNLYVGGSGPGNTMIGEFDDVIVVNRALTTSELSAIADAGRSDPESGRKLFTKSGSMRTAGSLSASTWVTIATQPIPHDMSARLALHNLSWAQASSSGNRVFRIMTNRHGVLATTLDEGLTLGLDVDLTAGDVVYFEARSTSGTASHRNVTNGHWLVREL